MALKEGKKRHGEPRRELEGVSHKMLIQTLRNLERNGLVEREVHPVVPPKVAYSLPPGGSARMCRSLLRGTVPTAEADVEDPFDVGCYFTNLVTADATHNRHPGGRNPDR
jgi:DNA-binding PadR family transcriptional regulator